MSIEVANETDFQGIDELEFSKLGSYVLEQMEVTPSAEMSIFFIDEDTIRVLHREWMEIDTPTDVMSFPMDELTPNSQILENVGDGFTGNILGDIVICPTIATKQAENTGHTAHEEMLLLATHGILHLLGFDHIEPKERQIMFDLQRKLLLGFIANRDNVPVETVEVIGLPKGN